MGGGLDLSFNFQYRTAGGRSISAALREGEESITKVTPLYQMNFV